MSLNLIENIFVEHDSSYWKPVSKVDELQYELAYLESERELEQLEVGEAIVEEISAMTEGDAYIDKAMSIGLGFPITEGVKDSIKNGYDVVIAFIKKILKQIKTFVLKIVDFIFGTDYAKDYEETKKEVKEAIKEDAEFKVGLLSTIYGKIAGLGKSTKLTDVVDGLTKEENESQACKDAVKGIEGPKPTTLEDTAEKKTYMESVKGALSGLSSGIKGAFENVVAGQRAKSMANVIKAIDAKKSVSQGDLVKLAREKSKYFEVPPAIPSNAKILSVTVTSDGLDIRYVVRSSQGKPKISKAVRRINPNLTAKELSGAYRKLNEAVSSGLVLNTIDDVIDRGIVSDKDIKIVKDYVNRNGDFDSALESAIREAEKKGIAKSEIDTLVEYYKFEAEATMQLLLKTAKRASDERRIKLKGMKASLGKDRKGRTGHLDFSVSTRTIEVADGIASTMDIDYEVIKSLTSTTKGKTKETVYNLPIVSSGKVYLTVKDHALYEVKVSGDTATLKATKVGTKGGKDAFIKGKETLDGTKMLINTIKVVKTKYTKGGRDEQVEKIYQITDVPEKAKLFVSKTRVEKIDKNTTPTGF